MKIWGITLAVGFTLIGAHLWMGLRPTSRAGGERGERPVLSFDEQAQWLNSSTKSISDIRGNAALVAFWTLGCCYCTNTLPYVKSWHERYAEKGLNVIGVHSPEFAYYADESLVRDALDRQRIAFPVILDHRLRTWDSFGCRRWPSVVLLDRDGRPRAVFDGPLDPEAVDNQIRHLLSE